MKSRCDCWVHLVLDAIRAQPRPDTRRDLPQPYTLRRVYDPSIPVLSHVQAVRPSMSFPGVTLI